MDSHRRTTVTEVTPARRNFTAVTEQAGHLNGHKAAAIDAEAFFFFIDRLMS